MVSEDDLNEIVSKVSNSSVILCSAHAKLYVTDLKHSQWKDSNLSGILIILLEKALHAVLFRLFSLGNYEMVFETELFYNFTHHYYELTPNFYSFPISGGQIGINFSNTEDASRFLECIKIYSPKEPAVKKTEYSGNRKNNWLYKLKNLIINKREKKTGNEDRKNEVDNEIEFEGGFGWNDILSNYMMGNQMVMDQVPDLNEVKIVNEEELIPNGLKSHKSTLADKNNKDSLRGTVIGNRGQSRKGTFLPVYRPTLSYKNTKIETFEDLEEKILGRKRANANIKEIPKKNEVEKQPQNYYNLLANTIAQRKAELEKYNSSEHSESGSNP